MSGGFSHLTNIKPLPGEGRTDYRHLPEFIRALLYELAITDSAEKKAVLMKRAQEAAAIIVERLAPVGWNGEGLPLEPDGKRISIRTASEAMEALALLWAVDGGPWLGRAQHVAHRLKSWQRSEGCWPVYLRAESGEPEGDEMCAAAPLSLLRRLDQLLGTCEYTDTAERAVDWLLHHEYPMKSRVDKKSNKTH